jgi:ubiquinone/menaquinone biosynthesis C-methylase UbiE
MAVYDDVAECYDDTRGGERRGDKYAAQLDRWLPPGEGPIVEVGVGTGVVALGLRRRGRNMIGVDVSAPMLARAEARLGPTVVRGDARRLPFRDASVAHAVSVWVLHAIDPPQTVLSEVARVLHPQGRFLVCPTTRSLDDDRIEPILAAMFARATALDPGRHPRYVSAAEITAWGTDAGFKAHIEVFEGRSSVTSAAEVARSILQGAWPALTGLDEGAFRAVTGPALEALQSLPEGPIVRRADVDLVVLRRD